MSKDRTRNGPKPKPVKRSAAVVGLIPNPVALSVSEFVSNGPHSQTQQADPTSLHGLANHLSARCKELLRLKGDLDDEEKAYLFGKLETMKDEKLKNIIVGLIGWGDDERAELETTVSVLIEVMRRATPEMIQQSARSVEFRTLLNSVT